jgi:hypothetical protein
MKIALIILAVIVVGIVGILTFAATKPDVFIVQRTASIKAPPEKVFPVHRRLPAMADLVALRADGFRDDAQLRRDYGGQGRDLCVGR